MAPEKPVATSDGAEAADLAKTFQELAKGERTATALENHLSAVEAKIEALLAQAEKEQEDAQMKTGTGTSTAGGSGSQSIEEEAQR